jgi:hypothetical protein
MKTSHVSQCCLLLMLWLNPFPGHCNSTYSTLSATRARLAAALGGAGGTFIGSCAQTTTGNAVCCCATRAVGADGANVAQLASVPWLTHTLVGRGGTLSQCVEASGTICILTWKAGGQCSPFLRCSFSCSCCCNAFTNINSSLGRARPECAQSAQFTCVAA